MAYEPDPRRARARARSRSWPRRRQRERERQPERRRGHPGGPHGAYGTYDPRGSGAYRSDRGNRERPAGSGGAGTGGGEGGIPDGLLVAILLFLLGLTVLTWTAAGLSGLLAHGSWPSGVTFSRTPLAIRELLAEPHDLAAAWPGAAEGELSGYGLFWGLFIGQVMVLVVLSIFVMGTLSRWRTLRTARRMRAEEAREAAEDAADAADAEADGAGPRVAPAPQAPAPATPTSAPAPHVPAQPVEAPPEARRAPAPSDVPAPSADMPADMPADAPYPAQPDPYAAVYGLRIAPDEKAATATAEQAVREAQGAVLVVTGDPGLYSGTVGARTKLGPAHVYDPAQLTDAPSRLRWAPHRGCEDMDVARSRAAALLAPVRSPARSDAAVHEAAETLLRCWLHAAAIPGEPFRQVHRWALSGSSKDAVRTLRTHTGTTPGASGELEATLTAHPERREAAIDLVRRALGALSQLHIRNACTPARADGIALASFAEEGGTLYLVGDIIEAPHRGDPAAMPLLSALTSAVVEHGRRMAARSSAGRLDPPLTIVLDRPATVAPFPELPALLADGEAVGLPTLALLRSEEQARTWWPELRRQLSL